MDPQMNEQDFNEGRTRGRQWAIPVATSGQLHDRLRAGSHGRRHAESSLDNPGFSPASISERFTHLRSDSGCDEVLRGILNSGACSTAQPDDREGRYQGVRPSTVQITSWWRFWDDRGELVDAASVSCSARAPPGPVQNPTVFGTPSSTGSMLIGPTATRHASTGGTEAHLAQNSASILVVPHVRREGLGGVERGRCGLVSREQCESMDQNSSGSSSGRSYQMDEIGRFRTPRGEPCLSRLTCCGPRRPRFAALERTPDAHPEPMQNSLLQRSS